MPKYKITYLKTPIESMANSIQAESVYVRGQFFHFYDENRDVVLVVKASLVAQLEAEDDGSRGP